MSVGEGSWIGMDMVRLFDMILWKAMVVWKRILQLCQRYTLVVPTFNKTYPRPYLVWNLFVGSH